MTWARISNGFSDPQTGVALAQDQVVRIVGQDGSDWLKIITLEGTNGRCPKILATPLSLHLRSVSERLVVSIAPFEGQETGDLSFGNNQLIIVEKEIDANWLSGTVISDACRRLGQSGIFPTTYIKEMTGIPIGEPKVSEIAAETATPRAPPSVPTLSARSAASHSDTIGPYARSAFAFQSEFVNELSFKSDQVIKLTRRVDTDWLEGEVNGKIGIFPASYVQIVVDLPTDTDGSLSKMSSQVDDGIGLATVKHPFEGRENDELTVQAGDSVKVLKMIDGEWAQCRDPVTDRIGIIPLGFLELYLDDEADDADDQKNSTFGSTSFGGENAAWGARQPAPAYSNIPSFSGSFPPPSPASANWAKFEDWNLASNSEDKKTPPARPPPPKSGSGTPVTPVTPATPAVSPDENAWAAFGRTGAPSSAESSSSQTSIVDRNKVLDELISTEQAFVTDMTALEKAAGNSSKLPEKHKRILVSGIPQIVEVSLLLADTLKIEKEKHINDQKVGEVFLNMQKMFAQSYGYFFRNIEQINHIVENKSDKKLQACLSDILQSMRSYGSNCFDVPTAVGRPVHRALKYPLFLGELIKHTSVQHPDHPKLLEALKQMSNLGQKMNESKRRKELSLTFQTVDDPHAEVMLSRKYSEEQSATLSQKLSRLSVHSVVKKSNRFKYRMGSAMGILHLTRDNEFDNLVTELDHCERRLVRFNYQLVIYQKKLQHDMKRQIEVLIIAPNASRMPEKTAMQQLKPFFEILADFVKETNFKVKDDCLKAIRVIPKKLIQKRNDKLMDYEAAKSAGKSGDEMNSRFKDFEALNMQVKTTVPKVIDVMNQVLRQGMQTLEDMDAELMRTFRAKFETEQQRAVHLLITPSTICFVELMDKNRLNPLKQIASKAGPAPNKPLKSSLKKKGAKAKEKEKKETKEPAAPYVPTAQQTAQYFDDAASAISPTTSNQNGVSPTVINSESLDAIWKAAAAPPPAAPQSAPNGEKKFRAQTEIERKTLLAKADAKNRRMDVYRCISDWPASVEAREASEQTGRMLIANNGDAVLAVRKEERGLWFCYNGYYNGLLPSGILKSYYERDRPGTNLGEPMGGLNLSAFEAKANTVVARPQSTPPTQKNNVNLIDLLDDIAPVPSSIPALVPQQMGGGGLSPGGGSLYPSLDAQEPSVNWGASFLQPASTPVLQPMQPLQPTNTQPRSSMLPWGGAPAQIQPMIPTTPSTPLTPTIVPQALSPMSRSLPPLHNGSGRSPGAPPRDDTFNKLWEEMKQMPLSKVRSESPQPLIPTRPGQSSGPQQSQSSLPSYDSVPMYSQPPKYDQPPAKLSASNPFASAAVYDSPPLTAYGTTPGSARAAPAPPTNGGVKMDQVLAEYDFAPVGPNQIEIREGERLQMIQRHDDDGNLEWVLVKKSNGQSGYVPSAYLKNI